MSRLRPMLVVEIAFWFLGALLIALFLLARLGGDWEQRRALADFGAARAATLSLSDTGAIAQPLAARPADAPSAPPTPQPTADPVESTAGSAALPVAVLRIASVELEVPVFADTSERNLNRGAGWVEGTDTPGGNGNMAIAGHRDRHFRPLKDLAVGDLMVLQSLHGERSYRVASLAIVEPEDVSPLAATEQAAITLVTCYPFHFVGNAPQRFIVRAFAVN
jgi:sortase A